MMDDATRAQIDASHPSKSTWLSANAGSGKTRVLTNRVARLLLNGADPQNILCLTYTKAAAGEMQNRLFGTLGDWAMLEDQKLREALVNLGETPPEDLSQARTLFARAIETPGGLKIQTIHSLCSAILRQFPLEGRVSPQFSELDTPLRAALIDDVLEELSERDLPELDRVSAFYRGNGLRALADDVGGNARAFEARRDRNTIFADFDVDPGLTVAEILNQSILEGDLAFLRGLGPLIRESDKVSDLTLADKLEGLPETIHDAFDTLSNALLTGEDTKFPFTAKIGAVPTLGCQRFPRMVPNMPRLETIMRRIETGFDRRQRLLAAEKTAALHDFARVFLPAFEDAKQAQGFVDFDDLIHRTEEVLTSPALSWVLFRLDGRIDHILVDEAQDTSPEQWAVISALTEELAAASDKPRTLFVVGDKKQSIYSFHGADASVFDQKEREFNAQMADTLRPRELLYSFRSSPAVLRVVDAMIESASGGLGVASGHKAFYPNMPGRVDLHPLIVPPEDPVEPPWHLPVDRLVDSAPAVILGQSVARTIKEMLEKETIPGENGNPRPISPGDIMILVQRRSPVFQQIIRSCKALNLPIAGADRLKIGAELAVQDLLALLSFLVLPEDNLSLAAVLRSPLFGWSERDIYQLAAKRRRGVDLWPELKRRAGEFPPAVEILTALLDEVDYLRPYELLDMILSRFGGRRKLLERLGTEAEDGIDELLNQALIYERDEVPSVTGFLARSRFSETEVHRQPETADDRIRIMTVHGAKGLESPIVILPDTTGSGRRSAPDIVTDESGLPMIPLGKPESPARMREAKDAKKDADSEERNRLLYVAMTRAEKWLIVCGVAPARNANQDHNWHRAIEAGMRQAGAASVPGSPDILRVQHGTWPGPVERTAPSRTAPEEVPEFLQASVTKQKTRAKPLAPSELGGAKVLGGGDRDEAEAQRRGRQIHLLLEHLPGATDPMARARALLGQGADRADPDEIPELAAEALNTLERVPDVFENNALAEVEIAAFLPTLNREMFGKIDRLIVEPGRIRAVDFKTNTRVPETPDDVPEGLLRQMGAYLEGLEQIYPDHDIDVSILWTATCLNMSLPHAIVREALRRSTIS